MIPKKDLKKILEPIEVLAKDPRPSGCEKFIFDLTGRLTNRNARGVRFEAYANECPRRNDDEFSAP